MDKEFLSKEISAAIDEILRGIDSQKIRAEIIVLAIKKQLIRRDEISAAYEKFDGEI